ncbi:MAG: NAD(P)/FAD-dependent oxidoreductase [Oscillospiraceae bacterium]|nr:NAD(P)/FAD-dependent oxidoreductase [Oscillospiraceae bacterium]
MKKLVVIGAGPAGIMTSIAASKENSVILIDKNEKIGKKLFITGKGRCNITNNKDISEFFNHINTNKDFLYSALYGFTNKDLMDFIVGLGVPLKVERGGRVFPESDKSSDIISALNRELIKRGVTMKLNSEVLKIVPNSGLISHVVLTNGEIIKGDDFVICTGGASYKSTGSTGDGVNFARSLGIKTTELTSALVPLNVKEDYIKCLQGLSLKNVLLYIYDCKKKIFDDTGEMLFTHFGISGPLVLASSSKIKSDHNYNAFIDLKPYIDENELDRRIQREFLEFKNKIYKNSLEYLFPHKIIPVLMTLSEIDENTPVNSITKLQRRKLVGVIKRFPFTITSKRDLDEAIVTKGGICVNEINPSNMQSKKYQNLYFAGEVIDVDAYTGGYNVQIAFSTGYACGSKIK